MHEGFKPQFNTSVFPDLLVQTDPNGPAGVFAPTENKRLLLNLIWNAGADSPAQPHGTLAPTENKRCNGKLTNLIDTTVP